jgi:MFS family permease
VGCERGERGILCPLAKLSIPLNVARNPRRAERGNATRSRLYFVGYVMVYPSLIAAVSDESHPSWRARSLSVYRFWRDLGYAVGALCAGIIAGTLGISWAIGTARALTFLSGAVVAIALQDKPRH